MYAWQKVRLFLPRDFLATPHFLVRMPSTLQMCNRMTRINVFAEKTMVSVLHGEVFELEQQLSDAKDLITSLRQSLQDKSILIADCDDTAYLDRLNMDNVLSKMLTELIDSQPTEMPYMFVMKYMLNVAAEHYEIVDWKVDMIMSLVDAEGELDLHQNDIIEVAEDWSCDECSFEKGELLRVSIGTTHVHCFSKIRIAPGLWAWSPPFIVSSLLKRGCRLFKTTRLTDKMRKFLQDDEEDIMYTRVSRYGIQSMDMEMVHGTKVIAYEDFYQDKQLIGKGTWGMIVCSVDKTEVRFMHMMTGQPISCIVTILTELPIAKVMAPPPYFHLLFKQMHIHLDGLKTMSTNMTAKVYPRIEELKKRIKLLDREKCTQQSRIDTLSTENSDLKKYKETTKSSKLQNDTLMLERSNKLKQVIASLEEDLAHAQKTHSDEKQLLKDKYKENMKTKDSELQILRTQNGIKEKEMDRLMEMNQSLAIELDEANAKFLKLETEYKAFKEESNETCRVLRSQISNSDDDAEAKCVKCNAPASYAFLPCGHYCACGDCVFNMDCCPMCRDAESTNIVRLIV